MSCWGAVMKWDVIEHELYFKMSSVMNNTKVYQYTFITITFDKYLKSFSEFQLCQKDAPRSNKAIMDLFSNQHNYRL